MDDSVVVVGGGPAGALAALKLARAGARVLVVDRERPSRVEAAEILAPEGRELLEREKLWPLIPWNISSPCTALGVAWERPDPVWTSFTLNPAGCAWHLDRIRLDAWLLRHLESSGVVVARGVVHGVIRHRDGWRVDYATDDARHTAEAACLILATGRSAHTSRLSRRHPIDRLCLVAGTAAPDPEAPDALIVEAAPDGWWYSAPLVDGRMFVGWMTDFSLVTGGRYAEAAVASLSDAPLHARRIGTPRLSTFIGSAAWRLSPAAGDGWMAIGDAALARDPISGDGLTAALRSACHAAEVVGRGLGGDRSVWAEAAAFTDTLARRYEQRRLDLYRVAQQRWPTAPFWQRFGAPETSA